MNTEKINRKVDAYLDAHWDQMLDEISQLVEIPSSVVDGEMTDECPCGTASVTAMSAALDIVAKMGFKTQNFKNVMGIADIEGKSKTQIGFIGHMDVVPAGPGWHFDPYAVTEKDGYLIGRGVLDDKGPTIICLHAINFWKEQNFDFPFSVRFLFGCDEETTCHDVDTFLKNFEQPKIVVTPDSTFPVAYGEKGIARLSVEYEIPSCGNYTFGAGEMKIESIQAGQAKNAVPGTATAIISKGQNYSAQLPSADNIKISDNGATLQIEAFGQSAHAANPQRGVNAIRILVRFLLDNNIGSKYEQAFFQFLDKLTSNTNGQNVNIDCSDEHFGELTAAASMLEYDGTLFRQAIDCRYPMSSSLEKIVSGVEANIPDGATCIVTTHEKPMFINPHCQLIKALAKSYTDGTGEPAKLFTKGGGTYARFFDCATSFGPIRPHVEKPDWVGSIHEADEGVSIDELKLTFRIYVHMVANLMQLNLDDPDFIKDSKNPEME